MTSNQHVPITEAIQEYNLSRACVDKGTLCHALENSMYFARDGSVLACCYSRLKPVGRYPEQTIGDIWNGVIAKDMRKALRANTLPKGCELCADVLLAHNFKNLLAGQFDPLARMPISEQEQEHDAVIADTGMIGRMPIQFEFELSNTCNLECAMCSGQFSSTIRMMREKLPALPQVYDSAFVEQLKPFIPHLKRAKFLGGEPFLIDVYYEIWDAFMVLNPDCYITITTNGTVYTPRVRRVLEKLNCQVSISLDSITPGVYEGIRVNGKLENTLANVDQFFAVNRRKNKGLSIAVCPMVSNCREMPDMVRFANERGIDIFFNNVIFPVEQSIRSMPPDVMLELVTLYRGTLTEPQNKLEAANASALDDVANQIVYWRETALSMRGEVDHFKQLASEIDGSIEAAISSVVISDIIREIFTPAQAPAEAIYPDDVHVVSEYFRALYLVCAKMTEKGVLSEIQIDEEEKIQVLTFVATELSSQQADTLLIYLRKAPWSIVKFIGASSAADLIRTIKLYVS